MTARVTLMKDNKMRIKLTLTELLTMSLFAAKLVFELLCSFAKQSTFTHRITHHRESRGCYMEQLWEQHVGLTHWPVITCTLRSH